MVLLVFSAYPFDSILQLLILIGLFWFLCSFNAINNYFVCVFVVFFSIKYGGWLLWNIGVSFGSFMCQTGKQFMGKKISVCFWNMIHKSQRKLALIDYVVLVWLFCGNSKKNWMMSFVYLGTLNEPTLVLGFFFHCLQFNLALFQLLRWNLRWDLEFQTFKFTEFLKGWRLPLSYILYLGFIFSWFYF